MNRFEAAMKEALGPVGSVLTVLDQEIERLEAELAELKAERQRGRKLMAVLDPDSVAKARPKKDSNDWQPSEGLVERILESVRSMNGDSTFNAQQVADLTGVHQTTIHKALKVLHDRGAIRLDHLGGARHTTRFFALVGGEE